MKDRDDHQNPLLKWGIAVVVTIPLCFLISSGILRIPLFNRVL